MKRAARSSVIAAIGFSAAIAFHGSASADSSIRVLVNDEPITSFDIAQRTLLLRITGEKGGEKAATEQLIDETLELADAKRRKVIVSDTRVDQAYAQISQRMKLSPKGLDQALATQGLVPESLKRRIKAQMAWSQLVQAKTRFEVSIKSSDVTKALLGEGGGEKVKTNEYTLQQVIFVMPKGSSAGYAAQRRREAESFRLRFAGCDKSVAQAKGLKDVVVRNIGRRTTDELTGGDGKDVLETPIGKMTRPKVIDTGVTTVAVCAIRSLESDAAKRSEIENKLTFEQGKEVGKSYLKELRDKAIIKYR